MANIIEEDMATTLETVAEMKDEEGVCVEPFCRAPVERDKADAGTEIRPPLQQRFSRLRRLQVEDRGTGEQHYVPFGQNEVVNHGRRREDDRECFGDIAGRVDFVE